MNGLVDQKVKVDLIVHSRDKNCLPHKHRNYPHLLLFPASLNKMAFAFESEDASKEKGVYLELVADGLSTAEHQSIPHRQMESHKVETK